MATELEQAKDLLAKLRAAQSALEDTGYVVLRGEDDSPKEYEEPEVYGRYIAVWWDLMMAINETRRMIEMWGADNKGGRS